MSGLPGFAYGLVIAPVAALALGFLYFHQRSPRRTHWPILASCLAVTAISLRLAWAVYSGACWDVSFSPWIVIGGFHIDFGLRIDGLSASVLAMVSVVGTLIHFYAVGYMEKDQSFSRFFLYFHFFFLSMVGLLISNNYLQMYLFWEAVGLSSYLLIGFWYQKESARRAAWKAFLTNRIGDLGFLFAVFLMLRALGTTRFDEVFAGLPAHAATAIPWIALLLFWGACAKSAQFPLYVWLPDAMEGPTPVSALMHAATMVTAGVFLMARSEPLLERAPQIAALIAAVGAVTAVSAAVFAAVKKDLKRILAYSTVSHLGLMMLGLGVGNVFGAVFHLIAHGFFKALLFLCAGNVIHGVAEGGKPSADVDDVGGLAGPLPVTFVAFTIGALALAGIPPLSGFFSKDLILDAVFEKGGVNLKLAGLLIAAGSSFYIFRMLFLTFLGRRPEQTAPAHAHEPNLWMQVPVLLLALGSVACGALGGVLAGMFGQSPQELSLHVMLWGLGFTVLGLLAAYAGTMAVPAWDWRWRGRYPSLEHWLDSDLGWQAATATCAGLVGRFARFLAEQWENRSWDPFTESLPDTCVGLGESLSGLSRGMVNDYLLWMLMGAAAFAVALAVW